MKKVKFGILCLLAGVALTACKKEQEKEKDPEIIENDYPKSDYTETAFDMDLSMVYVEGDLFVMGAAEDDTTAEYDEYPAHKVTLSSYHMSKYEITQAQWKAVMGTTVEQQREKAGEESLYGEGDNYPMYYVSWTEAKEFCDKLSAKTGKNYTLPTEAQWEFAARGGKKSKGFKYSGSNVIGDVAWYGRYESEGTSEGKTSLVGTKAPNELGIYDMSGNVWEWCADWYANYSADPATDPIGPSAGATHVSRGGSWLDDDPTCRVSYRNFDDPGYRYSSMGFRVVRVQ